MKFKILLIVCIILAVVAMGILGWQNYKDGYRDGLKEGEVYVVDGTEIYVAPEGHLEIKDKDAEIKIAEEGEEGFNITEEGEIWKRRTTGEDLMIYGPDIQWGDIVPTTSIIIHGEGDEDICVLDWSTGKLEFRGKMSSSARSFFKYFLKPYVDEYITEELDKKYNISILSCKKAIELKQKFSDGAYAYVVKDYPWPIRPSLFVGRFIEWLYLNDYEIVKENKDD